MATAIPVNFTPMAAPTVTPSAMLARATTAPVLSPAGSAPPSAQAAATPTTTPAVTAAPQRGLKRPRTKTADESNSSSGATTTVKEEPKVKARSKSASKAATPVVAAAPGEEMAATSEEPVVASGKDWLIVAKSVRSMLKAMPNGMHCGADALPMLNIRVQEMLTEAASRASGNGRKTLKGCDF